MKKILYLIILTLHLTSLSYSNVGEDYNSAKKLLENSQGEKAQKIFKKIIVLEDDKENTKYKALSNVFVGYYYFSTGNQIFSKRYFIEALKNKAEIENSEELIIALIAMTKISTIQNMEDEKNKYISEIEEKLKIIKIENENIYLEVADIYMTEKKYDKAEKIYSDFIEKYPKNQEYRLKLLEAYENEGDQGMSFKTFEEMKRTNDQVTALDVAFNFLFIRSNYDLSKKYIMQSIEKEDDKKAKILLGIWYSETGDIKESLKILNEAVENGIEGADIALKNVKDLENIKSKEVNK